MLQISRNAEKEYEAFFFFFGSSLNHKILYIAWKEEILYNRKNNQIHTPSYSITHVLKADGFKMRGKWIWRKK